MYSATHHPRKCRKQLAICIAHSRKCPCRIGKALYTQCANLPLSDRRQCHKKLLDCLDRQTDKRQTDDDYDHDDDYDDYDDDDYNYHYYYC